MDNQRHTNGIGNVPQGRKPLRQATLIVPTTGQRLKRNVTLHDPALFGNSLHTANGSTNHNDENTPLIPKPDVAKTDSRSKRLLQWVKHHAVQVWEACQTENAHDIFKCSLAYLIATSATFSVPIASVLGTHQDGNQVVANIVVWFDPARSVGSMELGILLGCLAFLYGVVIAFAAQGVSIFFVSRDLAVVGHVIVLLVFCCGSLGGMAWFKQHLGHPQVNTACSLASLMLVTTLIKEGVVQSGDFSTYKILQMLKMLVMGILITSLVNVLIWPRSARKKLIHALVETTDAFGESLTAVAACFLSGSEEDMNSPAVVAASDRFKDAFGSLPKHLAEARYEHYAVGTERQYNIERRLVECIQELAQDLGGLKSAASIQFALLSEGSTNTMTRAFTGFTPLHSSNVSPETPRANDFTLDMPHQPNVESPVATDGMESLSNLQLQRTVSTQSPAQIFDSFIAQLGPPMRSMAWTMKEVLKALPVAPSQSIEQGKITKFKTSLSDAITLFRSSRKEALDLVYKSKELSKKLSLHVAADFEEVAASCGHFSASLEDFAEDCLKYLEILDELELEMHERPHGRTWSWMLFWKRNRPGYVDAEIPGVSHEEAAMTSDTGNMNTLRQAQVLNQDRATAAFGFPYTLYPYFRVFRRDDVKFAIKVGVGVAVYAIFGFLDATRSAFHHWHLEWSLVSYMLACSMNLGASNTTAWSRLSGLLLGALAAIIVWVISRKNPYALAICGWLVSLICYYFIVCKNQGIKVRFILLTYNLTVLYSYALTVQDPDADEGEDGAGIDPQIFEIAFHRFVAVMLGVIGGVIVTYYIWPISAREKVKTGLSLLWLRMGLIWKRAPLQILLEGRGDFPAYMDIRTETKLREYVRTLDTLRKSAESEFELRGPFPTDRFDAIIKSTTRMLDSFHALKVVIVEALRHPSAGKTQLLHHTSAQCDDVALRLCHLLSVLASSLNMEYPLNDALPSTTNVRDRLLAKVFEFRQDEEKLDGPTDDDYELLYCYALVTRAVAKEIETCGKELEKLYSNLGEKVIELQ